MSQRWPTIALLLAALALPVGCAQNPYFLQRQVATLQQQQATLAQRERAATARAQALDADNQELQVLLAQRQQRIQLHEDELAALKDQLADSADQIATLQQAHADTEERAEALAASTGRRARATITANDSLTESLPAIDLPGVTVRRDGDVVRIEVPADKLFQQGSAQLQPAAGRMLEAVAVEVARTYPDHFLGVEGHTDSGKPKGRWPGNHQLSVAQATAVYDFLTTRAQLPPEQLLITGHGSNHPVVSNGKAAGRERNRRIELVVYPERRSGR